jgi:hypothetical protein
VPHQLPTPGRVSPLLFVRSKRKWANGTIQVTLNSTYYPVIQGTALANRKSTKPPPPKHYSPSPHIEYLGMKVSEQLEVPARHSAPEALKPPLTVSLASPRIPFFS